jgi:hypothetical protein
MTIVRAFSKACQVVVTWHPGRPDDPDPKAVAGPQPIGCIERIERIERIEGIEGIGP